MSKLTKIVELTDCFVHGIEWFAASVHWYVEITSFCNRLQSCVAAAGGHSEHSV